MAETLDVGASVPPIGLPEPLVLQPDHGRSDRLFRGVVRGAGYGSLLLLFLIGLFLFRGGYPALRTGGLALLHPVRLRHPRFPPHLRRVGLAGRHRRGGRRGHDRGDAGGHRYRLVPERVRPVVEPRALISMIDLAAAIPSIIFGLWAFFELQPNVVGFATWLSHHLSFIPFFEVISPPLNASIFIAGLVVGHHDRAHRGVHLP